MGENVLHCSSMAKRDWIAGSWYDAYMSVRRIDGRKPVAIETARRDGRLLMRLLFDLPPDREPHRTTCIGGTSLHSVSLPEYVYLGTIDD